MAAISPRYGRLQEIPKISSFNINHRNPAWRWTSGTKRNWRVGATTRKRPGRVVEKMDKEGFDSFFWGLFLSGATVGTLLNAIPSSAGMLEYDALPIQILGTPSSLLVPPFLGLFYSVLGSLFPPLDRYFGDSDEPNLYEITWEKVGLSFLALAGMFELTAVMYQNDVPYWGISIILSLISVANWEVFDKTTQGLILAGVCGVGVELIEVPILNILHPWHYTHPDLVGFPSFLIWCNIFYTPAIANLSRKLSELTDEEV